MWWEKLKQDKLRFTSRYYQVYIISDETIYNNNMYNTTIDNS